MTTPPGAQLDFFGVPARKIQPKFMGDPSGESVISEESNMKSINIYIHICIYLVPKHISVYINIYCSGDFSLTSLSDS